MFCEWAGGEIATGPEQKRSRTMVCGDTVQEPIATELEQQRHKSKQKRSKINHDEPITLEGMFGGGNIQQRSIAWEPFNTHK